MLHHYTSPPRPTTTLPHSYPNPAHIIQQLQQENQMLKQQISIMKIQMQSPSHRVQHLSPRNTVENHEDEAQVAYRNKMSKLKNKKATRVSEERSITTPSSPNTSLIHHPYPYPLPKHQQRPQSPVGRMILLKDNSGKFYRERSKEEMADTQRKNSQGRTIQRPNMPYKQNKENSEQKKMVRPSAHKRFETTDLLLTQGQRTKRTNVQTNAFPPALNSKHSPRNEYKTNIRKAVQQDRMKVIPRGNIYIQGGEQLQKGKNQTQPQWSDNTSLGDSKLSIQAGLRTVKSSRRLNYNIYLSEES